MQSQWGLTCKWESRTMGSTQRTSNQGTSSWPSLLVSTPRKDAKRVQQSTSLFSVYMSGLERVKLPWYDKSTYEYGCPIKVEVIVPLRKHNFMFTYEILHFFCSFGASFWPEAENKMEDVADRITKYFFQGKKPMFEMRTFSLHRASVG